MPTEIRYDSALNCLFILCVVDGGTPVYVRRILDDPEIPAGHLRLVDLRQVKRNLTTAELEGFAVYANQLDAAKPARRCALLVGDPLTCGLARIYTAQRAADDDTRQVFNDIKAATRWLGLPDALGDPFAVKEWVAG